MATNVPASTFGPAGFTAPLESAVFVGVMQDLNDAFGGKLNVATNVPTPQNQLATSLTAIIGEANDSFVFYTQQVDPNFASGRMQDALGRIYFMERDPSQPTAVQGVCVGLAGTVIPVGAQGKALDGNIYVCTQAGTIPTGGSITLPFACITNGPIACPENTLNKIYLAIPGWDSITNPSAGIIGRNTETRAAFEGRRRQSVAKNAKGSIASILGNVLNVTNVLDAYGYENNTGAPVTYRGFTLVKNSIYICAAGGLPADIAQAIWEKKGPGCDYNGSTTVTIYDTQAGLSMPYPAYSVSYQIPTSLPILYAVSILNNPQVPANAVTLIQQAILAAFAGEDGGLRARIGSDIFATRYIGPVAALGSWAQVTSMLVGSNNGASTATFTGSITGTVLTVSAISAGPLAADMILSDVAGDIPAGTMITTQATGSPAGTGTYNLSNSLTVASTTIKGALPDSAVVSAHINQAPTLSTDNIQVTLV